MAHRWLTAKAIADLALPGLPSTERRIRAKADREGWVWRDRQAAGGGREFDVAALPAEARRELSRRSLLAQRPSVPATTSPALPTHRLKGWQRSCLEARAALLAEVDRLAIVSGLGEARRLVEEASAAGTLAPELQALVAAANNRQGSRDGVSAVTLKRWHGLREKHGVAGLAPKGGAPEEAPVPAWLPDLLELTQRPGKPSVSSAYDKLASERPDVTLPPLRTVQRHVKQLSALERNRGRMGPRAIKALKAYTVRDVSELWPGAVYVADGHTHDAMVAHPHHGKPFRPEITTVVDVYTRRAVGWSVGLAENTWGTVDAYRHAFEAAALCDMVYIDRGKGFNNDAFDGLSTGFFARWGVTKKNSLPYNSQARGVIERLHQSIWIKGARYLPTFMGDDMDAQARKVISDRIQADIEERGASPLLQEWTEFLAWAQAQVEAYNTRPHSGLPRVRDAAGRLRHQSPLEAWNAAIAAGWQPETVDADDAPDLFRPYLPRVVSRGMIRLGTNDYFSRALEPWHGRTVLVGYDIHDASKVWVRDEDQRLICEAAWNGNRVAYMPVAEVTRAHERRQQARIERAEARVEKIREESAPAIEHHQVITLPLAREAEPAPVTLPTPAPELAPVDQALARFARARGLQRRLLAGEAVAEADAAWLRHYETTSEYRSHERVEALYGQPLVEPEALTGAG